MSSTPFALHTLSQDIRALSQRAGAVTVAISGPGQRPATGTIIAEQHVVAIHHVLGADAVRVGTPDGRTLEGTVVGRDDTRDMALLSVPGLGGRPLPRATAQPEPGDLVLGASRNPQGELSVSLGVVGALVGPLRIGTRVTVDRLIRADIASTRGISGGVLVDAVGGVLGILNGGIARAVPLALPVEEVERSVQELTAHGRVRQGFLGVGLQPVTLPSRQHEAGRGLLVVGLESDGPADRAGLLVGDILVSAAGHPTADLDALQAELTAERIGGPLRIDLVRATTHLALDVVVDERPRGRR